MNQSYIGLVERGQRVPSLEVLLAICEAIDLPPRDLFDDALPATAEEPREVRQVVALMEGWGAQKRRCLVQMARALSPLPE